MVEHVNFKGDEEPEVGLCKNLEPDTSDKQVNWSSRESMVGVFHSMNIRIIPINAVGASVRSKGPAGM